MKIYVVLWAVLLPLFCNADVIATAEKFCKNVPAGGARMKHYNSVQGISIALGVRIDANANNSQAAFERLGFQVLKASEDLPDGSILILDKRADASCPVSREYGDLVVKCGVDTLFWMPGQTKSLKQFLADHAGCVKSVMYYPKWANKAPPGSPPAKGDAGAGS